MMSSFSNYLIIVGVRSTEFTYKTDDLFGNKKYFWRCYKKGLSPYIALELLYDYINGDYEI